MIEEDQCGECGEYFEHCTCCEVCGCTDGMQTSDGTFCEECYAEACE